MNFIYFFVFNSQTSLMLREESKLNEEKVWTINGDDEGKECWIKMLCFYCKVKPEHRKDGHPYNRRKKKILFPFNIFKFHVMENNYYSLHALIWQQLNCLMKIHMKLAACQHHHQS